MDRKIPPELRLLLLACLKVLYSLALILMPIVAPTFKAFALDYPSQINFQHLLEDQDIVVGEVEAIWQDADGFMWFGGRDALLRYDGYEFKQMYINEEENDQTTIKKPIIRVGFIFEDSTKRLWIATTNGIYVYNRIKDEFNKIKNMENRAADITTIQFLEMAQASTGEILAVSRIGLFIINPDTLEYEAILHSAKNPDGPSHSRLNSIYIDNDDIWIGTEVGLDKFDLKTRKFKHYYLDAKEQTSIRHSVIYSVVPASDGKLWLGTRNGIILFDPKSQHLQRFLHSPNDPKSLGANDVWALYKDSEDTLWVALDGGGVNVYDEENNRFLRYEHSPGQRSSLTSNSIRSIFEDANGDIWVGAFPTGIDFFDKSSAAITVLTKDPSSINSVSHNSALSAQEDKHGNLWIGTDGGGVNYFDRDKNQFTHYKFDRNDPHTVGSNAILKTYIDSEGVLWVGTWAGGFASFDKENNRFNRYPFEFSYASTTSVTQSKKLNSGHVWTIYEDSEKNLWLGTHTGGLSKFDRQTSIFTHYWANKEDPKSLSHRLVWTILEDSRNRIWVGTSGGLDLLNKDENNFTHFNPDPNDPNGMMVAILEDSQGKLWGGSESGLHLMNPDDNSFTIYGKQHGLIDPSVRSIIEAPDGKIWVGSNTGIAAFDVETKTFKNYNRQNGKLIGSLNNNSALTTSKGELIFGGINGLRIFEPQKLQRNTTLPPIVFTELRIFADVVSVNDDYQILDKTINHTESITLDYINSMFVIDFASLNFRDSNKNQYAYMLEGFDDDWLNVGNQRSAKYTNIDAGTYTFRVRGSNNDGIWNKAGKSIQIIQRPPPWQTWWAYTIYCMFICNLILWFIYSQRRKRILVEKQNEILELKVAERTSELLRTNNDIQMMLSNMHQGLFTIQVGGKVHPKYSQFLESIFETTNIENKIATDLLFSNSDLDTDEINQVKESLNIMLGAEPLNYEFNKHLLVSECDINIGIQGKPNIKHLELDWNPIIEEQQVNRLMVTVRDTTQLRQMKMKADIQKREIAMIEQLLNTSNKNLIAFINNCEQFIIESLETIKNNPQPTTQAIALIFRNMHTIKGNSRTLKFTYLSDFAHKIESQYSELRSQDNPTWHQEVLMNDLRDMEKILQEYLKVNDKILGRRNNGSKNRPSGLWLSENVVGSIRNNLNIKNALSIKTILNTARAMNKDDRDSGLWVEDESVNIIEESINTANFENIEYVLKVAQSKTLEELLGDIISTLPDIAEDLGKEPPTIQINASNIKITPHAFNLVQNVFSHILRNSLDHGIESAENREDKGKPKFGEISIESRQENEHVILSIRDDGQGLDLDKLFNKGITMGIWSNKQKPSDEEIANLIFHSGISTKQDITEISGRGVGMDAVKQFLQEKDCDIHLKLLGKRGNNESHMPIEIVITLHHTTYLHTS